MLGTGQGQMPKAAGSKARLHTVVLWKVRFEQKLAKLFIT